mmetsp:Transcript_11357/g.22489  ORF Transcript_11357/g.22489 Transcript_11357/m.22489 type:complete len:325 (-) Transcript_11357:47-1021(-)
MSSNNAPTWKNSGQAPSSSTKRKRVPGNSTSTTVASASTSASASASASAGLESTRESTEGKASKGLRHFSMKVCKKVEEKGHTSYNEVADELVREFLAEGTAGTKYDEKNIRRRVYDALNVLMAMDIISKEKKEIRWKGLPSSAHHDLEMLQNERNNRLNEVQRKRECLKELIVQQVCFKNLVQRNREREASGQDHNIDHRMADQEKIPLPFIVVNTSSQTVIQCDMGPDRTDVFFNFSKPFEINDDNEILKRIGLNKTTDQDLRRSIPADLYQYSQEHNLFDSLLIDGIPTNPTSHGMDVPNNPTTRGMEIPSGNVTSSAKLG